MFPQPDTTHPPTHSSERSPTPTPSCSDSSDSLSIGPKRKPTNSLNPKPTKISKQSILPHDLPFDPFHPHPGMSKEERKLARMIRNRSAAQLSRDRKKEHVAELENRVKELEGQLKALANHQPVHCPRPCCQQPALVTSSEKLPLSTPLSNTLPQPTRMIPLESIDPSIIHQKPPSAPQSDPAEIDRVVGRSSITPTVDPLLTAGSPADSQLDSVTGSTISPAQAEYLSRIRIRVLEEENVQLKNKLEYEIKQACALKCRLLASIDPSAVTQQPPFQTSIDGHFNLDDGLNDLILQDSVIQNLLLTSPAQPHSVIPTPSPSTQELGKQLVTSLGPSPFTFDWNSATIDQEPPSSFIPSMTSLSAPADPFDTTLKAMKFSIGSNPDDHLSPGSSFNPLETQPVTPPSHQQPQAPFGPHSTPVFSQTPSNAHHRLVAREVRALSLQRIGWQTIESKKQTGKKVGRTKVNGLCQHLTSLANRTRKWLSIGQMMGMCCLIWCWVAWEGLAVGTNGMSTGPIRRSARGSEKMANVVCFWTLFKRTAGWMTGISWDSETVPRAVDRLSRASPEGSYTLGRALHWVQLIQPTMIDWG